MLNGQDVLVLVWLAAHPGGWTFRGLGNDLGMDPAALHRSVGRLKRAKLLDEDRQLNRSNCEEFLVHGVRYVVPGELGASGRGVPAAWGAEPLRDMLASGADPSPVWSDPSGRHRGPLLEPIADAAPHLAKADSQLAQWLPLLDAIRVGRARERKLASEELAKRIWGSDP